MNRQEGILERSRRDTEKFDAVIKKLGSTALRVTEMWPEPTKKLDAALGQHSSPLNNCGIRVCCTP